MTDANQSRWFVDTNVLVFAANPMSPWHSAAMTRLQTARREGITLFVNPQVVREFIAAASRPAPDRPPPGSARSELRQEYRIGSNSIHHSTPIR